MKDRMTYQERNLMLQAVIAHAQTKVSDKVLAHAYAFGMMTSMLTDEQVRDLFRMTHE